MTWAERVDRDRRRLRTIIAAYEFPVYLTGISGNIGDRLIWAGTEAAIGDMFAQWCHVSNLAAGYGATLVIPGSGGFGPSHHGMISSYVHTAAARFSKVIVLPTTFDVGLEDTRRMLRLRNVVTLARERVSAEAVGCPAVLDCGVHARLPRAQAGGETLLVLRSDREGRRRSNRFWQLARNDDISATARSLNEWGQRIAAAGNVVTDRAHVMIAAAILGKRVRYLEGNYYKNRALAEFMFATPEFDVAPFGE